MRLGFFVPSVLCCMIMVGCGGGDSSVDKLDTVPAAGKVTVDGAAFGPGTLDFMPSGQAGDRVKAASAQVGDDGSFTVQTYDSGDGIVPGTYRIMVSVPIDSADPAPNVEHHEVTIGQDGNKELVVDLKSREGNAGTLLSPKLEGGGASTAL